MRRESSILRKRRASDKVYVPKNSRDNHYLIAELPLTDALIELVVGSIDSSVAAPYQKFYQKLARLAFSVVEKCNISHANFVANNRLVRVRNSDEQQVLHTDKQSYFFYSPLHNSTFKGYFDGEVRSNKVKFLFLATGDGLRENAAQFHQKVAKAVTIIAQRIGLELGEFKVRDHQHLTYDLFANEKGSKESISHSFRNIATRYSHQGYPVEGGYKAITYAVISMPMARRLLKDTIIDYDSVNPFENLYSKIAAAFVSAAQKYKLNNVAMIANGMTPIVRYSDVESTVINGDIISLGYNPKNEQGNISTQWCGDKLVDTIRFVFCATEFDEAHKTYGKFVNQVTQAIGMLADELNWKKDSDYILMRLNQQLVRKI